MEKLDLRQWELSGNAPFVIDNVSIDSRSILSQNTLFVALHGLRGDGHAYVPSALHSGATCALVEKEYIAPPDIDEHQLIRVDSPLLALQDLARIYRESLPSTKIVAIAGSCGKTMLKDLMGHLFAQTSVYTSPESFNSQLGVALSVLHIPATASIAFIEMAATQPGEMERLVQMTKPDIALVTNFYRKRFGTTSAKETVASEILTLLSSLPPSGYALIENPTHHSKSFSTITCPLFFWNEPSPQLPIIKPLAITDSERRSLHCLFPNSTETVFTVRGHLAYLTELLSLAIQAAWKLGIHQEQLVKALQTYEPQAMRTEIWKNTHGTTFVNGTYCHTALSFDASLNDVQTYTRSPEASNNGKTILLFGGLCTEKNGHSSYKRIAESITTHGICSVYAWPLSCGASLQKASQGKFTVHQSETIEEAIASVRNSLTSSDVLICKGPKKIPFDWLIDQIEESCPTNIACINLAAIRSNIDLMRNKLKSDTRIMVMVKALAYGTDDVRLSYFLRTCGVDILGVSYVDEGVCMRKMGVTQDIFAIHASENEMKKAAHWNIEVGVSSILQIAAAIEAAKTRGIILKTHLHVDTGMKRFGCSLNEALELARAIHASPHLKFEGIFTHFPVADDQSQDEFTLEQVRSLTEIISSLESEGIRPTYRHACNSAASIRFAFDQFNMVRIGLATYGFHTSDASLPLLELRPALSLITRIAGFNEGTTGETVSYGRTHIISHQKARLAVLPIGYYDGLHRSYSGKGSVLIRGKRAPMVGRICMDYMMVDVTHIPEASIGDHVLLFGEDDHGVYLSPEELASSGGSIVHELMTCLGPRIQRLFIYDESLLTR